MRYKKQSTILKYLVLSSYFVIAAFFPTDVKKKFPNLSASDLKSLSFPDMYLPERAKGALLGSQITKKTSTMSHNQREAFIYNEFINGNVPQFIRVFEQVKFTAKIKNKEYHVLFFASPDYLSLGSDDDYIRVPIDFATAIKLSKRFKLMIPTKKMVDIIFKKAPCKVNPQPFKPGKHMVTDETFEKHNKVVSKQLKKVPKNTIKSGQKKDIILSNKLLEKQNRIAIYGWHRNNGKAIQPVSTVHHSRYVDYSHGLRLISPTVIINGKLHSIEQVLSHKKYSALLSDEGPIKVKDVIKSCKS